MARNRTLLGMAGFYLFACFRLSQAVFLVGFYGCASDALLGREALGLSPEKFTSYASLSVGFFCSLMVLLVFLRRGRITRRFDRVPYLCVECGYDLQGNSSGVCPECGTPIPDTVRQAMSR